MLSFNNKNIKELSAKELSVQIFNLSNFYRESNINTEYTLLTASIAELLEHNTSDFNFSLKVLKEYIRNPNFSSYEKTLVIEGYKLHLNITRNKLININENDINIPQYNGIILLIDVEKSILNYKQITNNTTNELVINKCIENIDDKIEKIKNFKEKNSDSIMKILNNSLKELYFCKNINSLIS